jgi:hypothetical protein
MTVWMALDVEDYLLSFLKIETLFENHGDGSHRAAIVATIAWQEQDAQVQGVTMVDWVSIVVDDTGVKLGDKVVKTCARIVHMLNTYLELRCLT